ncbi:MAG: ABC transporter permease [Trueperaceae bacterium]|nr:MAG: ABC transporter permease [Trueperaceae bacterium]
MNERLGVTLLALVALLGLWFAPWAAINRETGARGTVLLLPNRVIDFTGRTEPVRVPGQTTVLALSFVAIGSILAGAGFRGRRRYTIWVVAGASLIAANSWGLNQLADAVAVARVGAFVQTVERAIANPRSGYDVPQLERVAEQAPGRSLEDSLAAAREAGLTVRRLPYSGADFGPAAFLSFVVGVLAVFFGLRLLPSFDQTVDRLVSMIAVPAVSIMLSLVAAAVVVLALQSTPLGRSTEISGPFMAFIGRLDTLWHAYFSLFADSLGTLPGFMESLKFATPLIFTGLAVAFGFQAGLFNIGAPGQMVLGAIFAMLVGVYLPGPRFLVLPVSVLVAALGGGLWGAIPGWLKARFGAHEVINTILLNFVAASLLLFILSSNPTFAAPAKRIIFFLAAVIAASIVGLLIPLLRRFLSRSPRVSLAVIGVLVLFGVILFGLPRAGDEPITLNLPFKVAGSEPKSSELSEAARLPQIPHLFGIDIEETPGVNVVAVNYALMIAPLLALLALLLLPRFTAFRMGWVRRVVGAVLIGLVAYGIAAAAGLTSVDTEIPPSKLNLSFGIALLAAVFMHYLMWRTKWGYELRAVGLAPKAAEYGGASVPRNTVLAMVVRGAFAGLTACHYVLGGALEDYSLRQSLPTNDGFDGIAVALLGNNTPVGVILSAFLFGVLKHGGSVLNITYSDLTRDVVSMILALVVLFIAARGFLPERFTNPLKKIDREVLEPAVPDSSQTVTADEGGR